MAKAPQYCLQVADIPVNVTWKNVKYLTLAVRPPHGDVRVSAPIHATLEDVRQFVLAKMTWINRQLRALRAAYAQEPGARDSLCVWGEPHRRVLHPHSDDTHIQLEQGILHIYIRGPEAEGEVEHALKLWLCHQVRETAPAHLEQWCQRLHLESPELVVRLMKSRWGSCHLPKRKITLNGRLAEKPPICLEGVIVHELLHFFVANHSAAFYGLMDRHFPRWREVRQLLRATAH